MSRGTLDHIKSFLGFVYGTFTLYGRPFQICSTRNNFSLKICPQPPISKLTGFGLFRFRSPLLTESNFFLFLQVLRCFSSLSSPQYTMYSCKDTWTLLQVSFLIQKSSDQNVCATPRSLSQLITSFIGS